MPIPHKFTVFVLLYGDHLGLAVRCLSSLLDHSARYQIRIAMNECSEATRNYVAEQREKYPDLIQVVYSSSTNLHKYPVMRAMFHDPNNPIRTPYVVWFDDDSYVQEGAVDKWQTEVERAAAPNTMLGGIWFKHLVGDQADWVRDQPWYAGQELSARHRVRFITGGYWVIDTDVIRRFGWPSADIDHRGGDVMLGELCRQQGVTIVENRFGVAVNADDAGQYCKSPKRGYDSQPVGYSYSRRISSQLLPPAPPIPKLTVESNEPPTRPTMKQAGPFSLDL